MEILNEAPNISSFTPLIEHQSTTPTSFYSGPPVLHYHSNRSKVIVLEHEARSVPALAPLLDIAMQQEQSGASEAEIMNGGSTAQGKQKSIPDMDVYVTSDKLLLFSQSLNKGLSIPYPSISLHAIQSLPEPSPGDGTQGLYMQIIAQAQLDAANDEEEPESISLTVIPTAPALPSITSSTTTAEEDEPSSEQTPVLAMFNALSTCSNLHPDPVDPDDDDEDQGGGASRLFRSGLAFPGTSDGGLPPAMPGSGGWITAENMHEFFDAEGNWIGGDDEEGGDEDMEDEKEERDSAPLGPGAGTVRQRDGDGVGNGNGDVTAAEDETKWRRTG